MRFSKPVVFIDLEATGADAFRDRVVELALVKRFPDGRQDELVERVNPGVRIPAEATAVHGISNADIAGAPPFKDVAPRLVEFLGDADLAGFGICRFDIPLLQEEFKRLGTVFPLAGRHVLDGLVIYHQRERRDLSAAYQFYCRKTLEGAHGARADALASMEVLFAQLERYQDLPQDPAGLHQYCNRPDERFVDSQRKFIWRDGEAAINFGKHKGELLKTLVRDQRNYVQWIVSEGNFAQEVVDICWRALQGEFPAHAKSADGDALAASDGDGTR